MSDQICDCVKFMREETEDDSCLIHFKSYPANGKGDPWAHEYDECISLMKCEKCGQLYLHSASDSYSMPPDGDKCFTSWIKVQSEQDGEKLVEKYDAYSLSHYAEQLRLPYKKSWYLELGSSGSCHNEV